MNIYQSLAQSANPGIFRFKYDKWVPPTDPESPMVNKKKTEHKDTRKCGSALSAAPALQQAVTKLYSVKKVRVGKVTKLDAIFEQNSRLADAQRATKKDEEIAAET